MSFNKFFHEESRLLALYIFLIAGVLSLRLHSQSAFTFFTVMLLSSLSSLVPFSITKKILIRILFSSAIFLLVYGFFSSYIGNIELWGDEINVIRVAGYDFGSISKIASEFHIAVPPLDYWSMHFWSRVVTVFPVLYHEFLYRIPYMFMHALAAFIFALLVEKSARRDSNKQEDILVFFLSFVSYLVNPILFLYSIEVRYYALAALGSLIPLYLFVNGKLYSLRYYPLLLLFCLNSVFQFLVLIPYGLYGLVLQSASRRRGIILLVSLFILLVFIYPTLLIGPGVGKEEPGRLIFSAVHDFWLLQFGWGIQQIGAVAIFICLLTVRRSSLRFLFGVLPFYMISIITIEYTKQYFDFHVRHFIIAIPVLLYLLFLPLVVTRGAIRHIAIIAIVILFTIPWTQKTNSLITSHKLFSKSLIGSKMLVDLSKKNDANIIFAPNTGRPLPDGVYAFFVESAQWYLDTYSSARIIHTQTSEEVCRLLQKNTHLLVYSLTGGVDCLSVGFKKDYLYGSIVYYPLK